jgi:YVTN family beta-propeller protein
MKISHTGIACEPVLLGRRSVEKQDLRQASGITPPLFPVAVRKNRRGPKAQGHSFESRFGKTAGVVAGAWLLLCVAAGAQSLPNGWKITPAGTQVAVGQFPLAALVSPDGKYLLVMNAGSKSISVVDVTSAKEVSHTPVPDAWLGLTMTKAGDKVYVGGGARAAVFEFSFLNGALTPGRTFPIVAAKDRTALDFAGDVRLAPDGHLLYVANLFRDAVVVMNPQSGVILSRIKTGRRPYRILFHPSGKTMYVSSWADGSIGQYDVNSGEKLGNFRVAPHPMDMLWVDGSLPAGANAGGEGQPVIKARMFVAAANTNSVYVLGASETGDLAKLETINLALVPEQPLGMSPSALGLSADKKLVYVACSDANAIAVVDITGERNLVKGFVPAGAYPASVLGMADGRIGIVDGHSNSLQLVDAPDDAKLLSYSDQVMANFPYRGEMETPGKSGPIQHVIYVVRGAGSEADEDWLTAGIAPDYAVRLGDNAIATDPANLPPAGYLWNAASQAGLKIRNYGFEVHNLDKPNADGEQVDRVYDPALKDVTDMEYRGPDPAFSDAERAKEFATELKEYEQVGEMPQLLMVRIGSDEQALNTILDGVSKSRFRNEIAVFVADAGVPGASGAHVKVVSPLVKGGGADATAFDQLSVLRTVEMILGLRPMTVFDAAATPIAGAFGAAAQ